MTLKNTLITAAATLTLSLVTTTFATPFVQHHTMLGTTRLGENTCETAPGEATCITFQVDNTILDTLDVVDVANALVNGVVYRDTDDNVLGPYDSWSTELDVSDVQQYNVTRYNEYIGAINGRSVGRLCNVSLDKTDLLSAKNITMIVSIDADGDYTCTRF